MNDDDNNIRKGKKMETQEKLERTAKAIERIEREHIIRLCGSLKGNERAFETRIIPARKYTKIDVGGPGHWYGKYMVENDTGRIFGTKAYGVIHRGHPFGTLDDNPFLKAVS